MTYILSVTFAGLALLNWGHPLQGHLLVAACVMYSTSRVLEKMGVHYGKSV